MSSESAIKESTIRELIQAGSICKACVQGAGSGFSVTFTCGNRIRVLESSRGQIRRFASLNTALEFLKHLGIFIFEVDSRSYVPGRLRKARPDRAAALRKTKTTPRQQESIKETLEK